MLKKFKLRSDVLEMSSNQRVQYLYNARLRKFVSEGVWKDDAKRFRESN